jgi:hypothetical protein
MFRHRGRNLLSLAVQCCICSNGLLCSQLSMGGSADKGYTIAGHWDPTDPNFQILNTETPKGQW